MLLSGATDKFQLVTSSAATIDVCASSIKASDSTGAFSAAVTENTAISSATTTDIVAAAGSSTIKRIKSLFIRNKSASTACTVTVLYKPSGTAFEMHSVTLQGQECLQYVEGLGFFTLTVAAAAQQTKLLTGDQSNSTTTPTKVTGLTLAVGVGTYQFQYNIIYQAAATTTGVRFSVNHDGTVTSFVANSRWVDNSATASTAAADQDAIGAAGQCVGAMAARAISTAGWGTTISVDTANADMLMIIEGSVVVTAAGNLDLWHGSEVAAASTTKAGSSVIVNRVS